MLPVPENVCEQVDKITFNFICDNKIVQLKKKDTQSLANEKRGLNRIAMHLGKVVSSERELSMDGSSQ